MAVQHAMRHFNSQFNGRHLIVFTDHKPLIGSFGSSELQAHDPIALNAINEIAMFTSDLRHKEGKELIVPDHMSCQYWTLRAKMNTIAPIICI